MIYLTHTRLMDESEHAVHDRADRGEEVSRRVCGQLIADAKRYALWLSRHDCGMRGVAQLRRREQQMLTLRSLAITQVHRAALVRYFRDYNVTGVARDQTLLAFNGVIDPRRSVLSEHRNYLMAASSQWCASDLLELTGDKRGVALIQSYEQAYGQFFSMFCDNARATRQGVAYVLGALVPEARAAADRLKGRIMSGQLLPPPLSARRVATLRRGLRAQSRGCHR